MPTNFHRQTNFRIFLHYYEFYVTRGHRLTLTVIFDLNYEDNNTCGHYFATHLSVVGSFEDREIT